MARKYDLISELYNRTCKTVVSNPQNWQAFLASACRNYKLRYDEQLLVYAQRPDATAVLEIEQWNKIFGRWVNRGARGIAVFADENRSRQRLTHYFDISDTHESRYSRTVPIWDMRQEYEADVIETLESTFGEIENKSSLAEAIMGAARNAAEDNIPDYLQDLYYATEGSSFEEVEEDIVAFIYKNVVTNSVAYMMMSRLGVDTDGYFELDDFRDVTNFNTQETLNALGFATSDIAEMGLTEISKTITALNRQNRIIVGQDRNEYNKVENNDERSLDNERTDLHDGGRLQPSEPETSTAAGSDVGQIRSDEERVSEGTSQSPLLQSPDEGRTDTALGGSGTESQQDGGNNPEPDGTERGSDRTDESGGYDEMGSSDELPSQLGTGNRESGSDIRLEYYDRTHEDKSLPFFGRDEVINEILRTTPHLSASLEEIKDYYERNPDNKDRTEYVKSIIDRCTASVYRSYQQNDYQGHIPTLQDFRAELLQQDEPEAKELALAIELFTHGSLNTFAKQTNVDTNNRLICYDILDLGKQLMPIGMLVVLDSILNRITQNRAKGKNTFIFIDEIYLLFQHEYSANFLFTLWKRVRKYSAYASGITQNVDDLLQSHTARTMLANSEFIIMLNQASTDRLELAKLLNISDLQMSYITNVEAGHGLIKVGSSLVPFANKFPKNTKLYKLMTTKPGEA